MRHKHSLRSREIGRTIGFSALCVIGSFVIGIQSAGEVHPFGASEAESFRESIGQKGDPGDITLDGIVSIDDVIAILEIAQGYRVASAAERKADPNADGVLTVEDALRVLRTLSIR